MFVDTEISEMNKSLCDAGRLGGVSVGGEPRESLIEHVDPERIIACDHHVDS